MKPKSNSQSAFVTLRLAICFVLSSIAVFLALLGFGLSPVSAQAPNAAQEASGATFGISYHNDVSPPGRSMPPMSAAASIRVPEADENPTVPYRPKGSARRVAQSR